MSLLIRLTLCAIIAANGSLASAQPPGKHWEAVAYNETSNELAVFSGAELKDKKFFVTDSLWLFTDKWQVIDGNGIPGRWAHGMVYHNSQLYTYGGMVYNSQNQEEIISDLYRFDKSWMKIDDGPKLSTPELFSVKGELLLAGQSAADMRNFEVWELKNGRLQKRMSVDLGTERDGLQTLLVKNEIVVVCPSDSGLVFQNINTGAVSVVRDLPVRTKFAVTYNLNLDCYFLFGGLDEKRNFTNDLWKIRKGAIQKLNDTNVPSPRASCSMVPTSTGFILYGGVETGGRMSNEVWQYDVKWKPFGNSMETAY